jgi:IS5 family transposase
MSVKKTGLPSFVEALMPDWGRHAQLDRLKGLVKWYRLEKPLAHLRDEATAGRPGYPVAVLLRALLLQSLYGLSDRELKGALTDRLSFKRFCGLGLDEAVPDHTVLNRFRNRLIEDGLLEGVFGELDRQLENSGVILKRGTMLDATLIETVSRPPSRGRPGSDPDARFAKRQGKAGSSFGYKAHLGVDEGSGLIRAVLTTPANVNDTVVADRLIRFDEKAVYADKAYAKAERRSMLRRHGIKDRIMHKSWGGGPKLTARQTQLNRRIAPRRAAVETTFATWKCRMRLTAIRYRGLVKASAQILLAAIAFNMRRWAAIAP